MQLFVFGGARAWLCQMKLSFDSSAFFQKSLTEE